MALTEDQILQQINVLATKTSDNPNMVYKSNATLNKGLNPEFFTGNNTKIVNAINSLALKNQANEAVTQNVSDKVNQILLDTSSADGSIIWEHTKELMGANTIIEGINNILSGGVQDKLLNFTIDDAGKVLTVQIDDQGKAIAKPQSIEDMINVTVDNLLYSNDKAPSVNNVHEALDYLFNNQGQGGSGGTVITDVDWEDIKNKPEIANQLELDEERLVLKNEQGYIVSEVQLVSDEDIDNMLY